MKCRRPPCDFRPRSGCVNPIFATMVKQLTSLIVLLIIFGNASSQALDSLLDLQRKADPQEKVYVQFDKSYYNPGETIWYKAYLFTGNEPSNASKNFYAELV